MPGVLQTFQGKLIYDKVFRDYVFDRHLARIGAAKDPGGELAYLQTHAVEVSPGVEQGAAIGGARRQGEDGEVSLAGRGNHRIHGHNQSNITADPDGLGAARGERINGLAHTGRVVHVGFQQRDPQLLANFAALDHKGAGIGLRGVPCHADSLQSGKHLARDVKRLVDGHEAANPNQIGGMVQRLRHVNSNPRSRWIGDRDKKLDGLFDSIGIGERLHGDRAGGQVQVVIPGHDLPSNGITDRDVAFGVEPPIGDRLAFNETFLGQSVHHAPHCVIKHRGGGVLKNRDLGDMPARSRSPVQVGDQQAQRGEEG